MKSMRVGCNFLQFHERCKSFNCKNKFLRKANVIEAIKMHLRVSWYSNIFPNVSQFSRKMLCNTFQWKNGFIPKIVCINKTFFDFIRNVFVIKLWMHRLLFYAEIFGLNSSIQGSKLIVYSYKWEKEFKCNDV